MELNYEYLFNRVGRTGLWRSWEPQVRVSHDFLMWLKNLTLKNNKNVIPPLLFSFRSSKLLGNLLLKVFDGLSKTARRFPLVLFSLQHRARVNLVLFSGNKCKNCARNFNESVQKFALCTAEAKTATNFAAIDPRWISPNIIPPDFLASGNKNFLSDDSNGLRFQKFETLRFTTRRANPSSYPILIERKIAQDLSILPTGVYDWRETEMMYQWLEYKFDVLVAFLRSHFLVTSNFETEIIFNVTI